MKAVMDSFSMRFLLFLFFVLVAASQLAPLYSNTFIPNEADLVNHVATIVQASLNLTDHQFPLRITPLQYQGWSYPLFQFYAPTSYLYAGFIYQWLTPANPYLAYKVTIWSLLVLGGIYMYRLTYWLTKSYPVALLASTVFLTAPYFNILIGALGGFNETIAIALVPFILYYTLRYYANPNRIKHLLLVSAGWYVFMTTHIITFTFGSVFIGILLLLLTLQTRRWQNLLRVGIAILFGGAMAVWFLVPEALFAPHFAVAVSFSNPETVYFSHPTLGSILSPALSKILNMQQNVSTRAHQALGLPILVGVGVAVYGIFLNSLAVKKNKLDYYLFPLMIIFLLAFFLLWSPVDVWRWLPKSFLVVQYTMRLEAQIIWIGPLIFAWSISWLFGHRLDARHTAVGVLLLFAATNSLLPALANSPHSIEDIIKKPNIIFNPNSYLLDVKTSPQFVDQIDNYQLATLQVNNKLVLNSPFYMPKTLLRLAVNPQIHVQGRRVSKEQKSQAMLSAGKGHEDQNLRMREKGQTGQSILIPGKGHKNQSMLTSGKDHEGSDRLNLVVDNKIIASLKLPKLGRFEWNVPLSSKLLHTNKTLLPIEFKWQGETAKQASKHPANTIHVDKVELTGFLNPPEVLTVNQLASHCKTFKEELICSVWASKEVRLIELPMFYYPRMLKVTLNGKQVPYQGVLADGKIVVGIVPKAGGKNIIRAKFVGLPWANLASKISWGLWLFIAMGGYVWYLVKRRRLAAVK